MKKILILAYDFPPYVSVGGLRPYNWFKYLVEFGYYPVIITRQWDTKFNNHLDYITPGKSNETIIETFDHGTIVRTPYHPNFANKLMLRHGESKFRLLRKAITAYYEFTQFLAPIGPKKELYKAAKKYLKENDVEAIVATGDPFILLHYAHRLSKQYSTPWIADYRDPWSNDIYLKNKPLLKWWSRKMEQKTVSTAQKVITVSALLEHQIKTLIVNVDTNLVPNGYDPEAIAAANKVKQGSELLQFAFIGRIYDWYPIESFLRVFNEFANNRAVQLNLYGLSDESTIRRSLNDFENLQNKVSFYPTLPNSDLMKEIATNNVMILFNTYSIAGTKIYDYIGVKRKILLCYSNDSEANALKKQYFKLDDAGFDKQDLQAQIIAETNAGTIVEDSVHLKKVLEEIGDEFQNNGSIECATKKPEEYSRKFQSGILASIIRSLHEST